jgi:hypothetical protein
MRHPIAIMAKLIVLAATLLSLAGTAVSANEAADKPKLTARPTTSLDSALTLTSLDEKSAFERSQAAIGKSVGDFVLLNRDGTPVELSKYRGKPLLVNFVYTACFQVFGGVKDNPLRHLGAIGLYLLWIVVGSGLYLYTVLDTGIDAVYRSIGYLSIGYLSTSSGTSAASCAACTAMPPMASCW